MGEYREREYFGVEWRVFVVNSLEEGIAAIQRGEEAVKFDWAKVKIGPDGAKKVAAELKNNRTLKLLDLRLNQIGPEGAGSLAEALKRNSTLTFLSLQDNKIGDAGAGSLAEALKVNRTLTTFYLSSNRIGPEGAGSLAEALKENSTLTSLHLTRNNIGPEGAGSLVEALKANNTLTTLSVGGNKISDAGAGSLAEALKVNRTLTTLSLWRNEIGDVGAGSLAEALKVNSALTTLDLRFNKIGPEGAGSLAEALKVNTTLSALFLYYNKIGDAGAGSLAEALKVNRTLTTLDLRPNRIGDQGAGSLAEALKFNSTLTSLDVRGNDIGARSAILLGWCGKRFDETVKDCSVSTDFESASIVLEFAEAFKNVELEPHEVIPDFVLQDDEEGIRSFCEGFTLGQDSNRHVKAMLVGIGTAGKTSLCNALQSFHKDGKVNEALTGDGSQRATRGVHVKSLESIEIPESTESKTKWSVSMWDFGGQPEYYATHSFFLTRNALVILCVNIAKFKMTKESFDQVAGHWLRMLQGQMEAPKLLLVGTHADELKDGEAKRKLENLEENVSRTLAESLNALNSQKEDMKEFGDKRTEEERRAFSLSKIEMVGSFPVSSKTGFGIEELHDTLVRLATHTTSQKIQRAGEVEEGEGVKVRRRRRVLNVGNVGVSAKRVRRYLNGMASIIPKPFKKVLDLAESYVEGEPWVGVIEISEWVNDELAKPGISEEEKKVLNFLTPKMIRQVLRFLTRLGLLVWLEGKELSKYVFLRPQWVVNVLRALVRHDMFKDDEAEDPGKHLGRFYEIAHIDNVAKGAFEKNAELHVDLLRQLLLKEDEVTRDEGGWLIPDRDADEEAHFEFLDVCETLLIEFDLLFRKEEDENFFVVPSYLCREEEKSDNKKLRFSTARLRRSMKRALNWNSIKEEHKQQYEAELDAFEFKTSCSFGFPVLLPIGLVSRFVCKLAREDVCRFAPTSGRVNGRFSVTGVTEAENHWVDVGDLARIKVILEEDRDRNGSGWIHVTTHGPTEGKLSLDDARDAVMQVFQRIVSIMNDLLQQYPSVPYTTLLRKVVRRDAGKTKRRLAIPLYEFERVRAKPEVVFDEGRRVALEHLKMYELDGSFALSRLRPVLVPMEDLTSEGPFIRVQNGPRRLFRFKLSVLKHCDDAEKMVSEYEQEAKKRASEHGQDAEKYGKDLTVLKQVSRFLHSLQLATVMKLKDQEIHEKDVHLRQAIEAAEKKIAGNFRHRHGMEEDVQERTPEDVMKEGLRELISCIRRLVDRIVLPWDVFLSHNWGSDESGRDNHQRVDQLREDLEGQHGLKVWFDAKQVDYLEADLNQKMRDGIDMSGLFGVCITQEYMEKTKSAGVRDYCEKELRYGANCRPKEYRIPIVMEESVKDEESWYGSVFDFLGQGMRCPFMEDRTDEVWGRRVEYISSSVKSKLIPHEPKKEEGGLDFKTISEWYRLPTCTK